MRIRRAPLLVSLAIVIIFGVIWLLASRGQMEVLDPKGVIASEQYNLIIFTTALGLLVIIPVFAMLFGFMWKYRAGNDKARYTPDVASNNRLEAVWWGIPIIIIAILSVVTYFTTHQLDPYRAIQSDKKPIRVQVVALQWRWLFIYPDENIATINELYMPVGRPVEFFITADAPMSAFWIPSLGSQTYAMNGMTAKLHLQADKAGVYRGTNTNINGEGYARMNFSAIAGSDIEYAKWVQAAQRSQSMNWSTYEQVKEPSQDEHPQFYRLEESALYDKVMGKYMDHMSRDAHDMKAHHEGMSQ
jgi:cytochrome o ubiquinol oxidase subunit II